MTPFISICIPSYKRTEYLKRLLDSVVSQQYKNYEVVVSDDTPGAEVMELCNRYKTQCALRYTHNEIPLGTPENWNEAIRRSTGEWVKIMHDDDWFASPESLGLFAAAITAHPDIRFFFSAHQNIYEEEKDRKEAVRLDTSHEKKIRRNPLILFRNNYIGNPSCTLYKKNEHIFFDSGFKWVVDFEFYIRYLGSCHNRFFYIDKLLVNTSLNASQVTSQAFRNAEIEIPENHRLIDKMGPSILRNIFVYDYYWRCYRNLEVKDERQVNDTGYKGALLPVLKSMIRWQRRVPGKLLFFGPFSKLLMLLHYACHQRLLQNPR